MSHFATVQLRGLSKGAIDHFLRQAGVGSGGSPASSGSVLMRYAARAAVPAGGTRYLDILRGIPTSVLGDSITAAGTLKGIVIGVNNAENNITGNDYILEVCSNPAAPVVLQSLSFPKGLKRRTQRGFTDAIPAGTELCVRMRRTSGSGGSAFNRIVCVLEYVLP